MQIVRKLLDRLPQNVLGAGLITLFAKVAGAGLSYAMMVALARMMSPEQYGYFGQGFNLAILLSTVCSLGTPTAVMRYWPEYMKSGREDLATGFARAGYEAIALFSAGAVALAALLSLAAVADTTLGFRDAPLAITAFASMTALSDYCAGLLRAQGRIAWAMVPRDVIWRGMTPVIAFALSAAGFVLDARLALYCCAILLLLFNVMQMVVSRKVFETVSASSASERDWSAWRRRLVPMWAAAVMFACIQQLDVVVVGSLVGPTDAGAYFVAQKTASLLGLVMIAGGLIGAPLMSAQFHSGRLQELQKLCNALALTIAVTTLAGFIFLVFAGKLLLSFFDSSYVSAYPVLLLLAVGYTIDAMSGPSAYLMQMTSLETPYLKIMAGCYAVVLALQFILVPRYGGAGAAVATMLGIIVWNVLAVRLLRARHKLDPSLLGVFFNPQASKAASLAT